MKKIFISLLALVLVSLNGQTKKGDLIVGASIGNMRFSDNNSTTSYPHLATDYKSESNSFSFSINPEIGWFLADNFAVGAMLYMGISSSNSSSSNNMTTVTSEGESSFFSLSAGPFARYYFGNNEKGKPFAQASFEYGLYPGKSKSSSSSGSSSETKYKPKGDWIASASFGYEHFISEYVGVFAMVGVGYGKSKTLYEYRPSTGTGYDYTYEDTRFFIPLNFGLQIHIPSSKSGN